MSASHISHSGKVTGIVKDNIYVTILSQSACSSCHSKSVCSLAEMKEKIIEIQDKSGDFSIGDNVKVVMKEELGLLAVFFAYVLPVVLLITVMFVLNLLKFPEYITGISVILLLTSYFILLYLLKNKIQKKFSFSIEKTFDL